MEVISQIEEAQNLCKKLSAQGKSIALVPTMGFLHEGHLSLISLAKSEADIVIVSRFVNPTQFAPNEDLEAYPNDREHDHFVIKELGADYIFEPEASSMYGINHLTWVEVPSMATRLCGKTRPTHFRGVCTVLTKLFNILRPDVAVFGEKDWQQLTIIRQMVRDLNMSVRIVAGALIRENENGESAKTGLAMSSRNAYLTKVERVNAHQIYKGLLLLQEKVHAGETKISELEKMFTEYLSENLPSASIDYIQIFNQDTLEVLENIESGARVAVAVYLGKARLLDNLLLTQ